ncbi:universal stress protein [Marinibacterium profundimaris]|uniref:Universal stress protein UspA n=1 Tax=Marinibacterium profundimaris TaxID=1679460 RepID=A0A225NEH2_9RHOB|nr:universal stress protein [Marinibacterium profundimaris]OWU71016.1 universal stress protein UspA [Marinibacterium profundimaris]
MFSRVLLAIDLNETEGARRAAKAALSLIAQSGGELHVVNVIPDSGMAIVGASIGQSLEDRILTEAKAALLDFANDQLPDLPAERMHVVQGTIYDRIIRTADEIEADTIVVGAHRPEFKDYLVGPNAARVVRHANQSVLVIR